MMQSSNAADAMPPEQPLSSAETNPLAAKQYRFGNDRSLSEERGQDWALPEEVRGRVPLTRPIRIVCRADHLAVLSDDPRRPQAHVIPLGFDTERNVDELVSVLWKRVDRWGTPGNGMYWRPTLVLEVPPDGRKSAAELESLLEDCGLELRVNHVNPYAAPAPPRAARR
jgi:hypothetical protein